MMSWKDSKCNETALLIFCSSYFPRYFGLMMSFPPVLPKQTVCPSRIFLALVILFPVIFPSISSELFRGNETDRLSLLAFKSEIVDPFGALSSWNEPTHLCQWFGVTCGRRHRRVTMLELNSSRLTGSLSVHLGNLSFLKLLNLENNSFSGDIPHELGRLHRLEKLSLRNNTFSGEIPVNISHCPNLQVLFLSRNRLTGKLPAELGLLSKLEIFSFHTNKIAGEIPPSLGNLSSLNIISGGQNSLSGVLPDSLGRLTKLSYLELGVNNLTGLIPHSLYNLSSLIVLAMSVNQLEGTLPPDLGLLLPNIERLELGQNRLYGPIPTTISNASKLLEFQLYSNKFSGKVPPLVGMTDLMHVALFGNNLGNGEEDSLNFLSYLVNCSYLEDLDIYDNSFGGLLPEYISNFSRNLMGINFGRNLIRGHIPSGIRNLVNLEVLELESNELTGTIPSSLGDLQNLKYLSLRMNQLSGSIPSSLGNLTSLLQIELGWNDLQGSIPTSLAHWKNVLGISLQGNKLSGDIPKEIMSLSSLSQVLFLADNKLTGSIPVEVGQLVNLGYLDLSNNRLSGEVPGTLGSCVSLEGIDLGGNQLQGPIPESLKELRAIQSLDLSHNNFSGKLPEFFGAFSLLSYLNLSFNNFEGEVPTQGVFRNASAVSLLGNKKLCGGGPQLKLPRCTSNVSERPKSLAKLKMSIAISSGLILLGLILLFSFVAFRRSRKAKSDVSTSSVGISFPRITYGELFKATNGFSPDNLIGKGGFGSVYKGILHQDETETVVAVKVLNLQQKGALKSFVAECEALRNIKHRNLVKTLTVCSSANFSGDDFKALVYEFMENGSLEEWLHPIYKVDSSEGHPRRLDLIHRLNITIDIATAVDYLHNHCSHQIVHRDLKPSNVLLDKDMTACIGDFGLARLLPEAFSHSSSNQASSAGFRGSIGYAAPEYAMGGEVSTYGDIYSYGILVLEIFTGKRPTDEMFKDELNIHEFVEAAVPEGIVKVADPVLVQERERLNNTRNQNSAGNDERILACLTSILGIGLACSAKMPRDRMNIADAAAQLSSIRDKMLGAGRHHGDIGR